MSKRQDTVNTDIAIAPKLRFESTFPDVVFVSDFIDGHLDSTSPWSLTLRLEDEKPSSVADASAAAAGKRSLQRNNEALRQLCLSLRVDVRLLDGSQVHEYCETTGTLEPVPPLAWAVDSNELAGGLAPTISLFVKRGTLPLSNRAMGAPMRLLASYEHEGGAHEMCWSPAFFVRARVFYRTPAADVASSACSADAVEHAAAHAEPPKKKRRAKKVTTAAAGGRERCIVNMPQGMQQLQLQPAVSRAIKLCKGERGGAIRMTAASDDTARTSFIASAASPTLSHSCAGSADLSPSCVSWFMREYELGMP